MRKTCEIIFDELRLKLKEKEINIQISYADKDENRKEQREQEQRQKQQLASTKREKQESKRICGIIGGIKRANSWIKYNEYKPYSITSRSTE